MITINFRLLIAIDKLSTSYRQYQYIYDGKKKKSKIDTKQLTAKQQFQKINNIA